MSVKLIYSEPFTSLLERWEEVVKINNPTPLRKVLLELIERNKEKLTGIIFKDNLEEMAEDLVLAVNGINYKFKGGLDMKIKDGDKLYFMWNYYGG